MQDYFFSAISDLHLRLQVVRHVDSLSAWVSVDSSVLAASSLVSSVSAWSLESSAASSAPAVLVSVASS